MISRASTPKIHPIPGPFPQQVHHEWIFPGARPSVKLNTSNTALFKYSFKNDGRTHAMMSSVERSHTEQRPSIVLTALDRERLFALLVDALTTVDIETACFLREEIERADIAPDDIAPNSVVRLGSNVKFVDHADARIRRVELVFPEESQCHHCISVLSPIGSALIGLGPGQSIRWTEKGRQRSLAVLEVRESGREPNDRRRNARSP